MPHVAFSPRANFPADICHVIGMMTDFEKLFDNIEKYIILTTYIIFLQKIIIYYEVNNC